MSTPNRGRRRVVFDEQRSALHPLPSHHPEIPAAEMHLEVKEQHQRKKSKIALEKKDWEDVTCSVCMEYPHNAVLLLCSSHDRGCRPYMCDTSYRYSNCLEKFKKAYNKVVSPSRGQPYGSTNNSSLASRIVSPDDKSKVVELACPLCRGKVEWMMVVKPARGYLNALRRSCTLEDCSFMGTYIELRKHVKQDHPCILPHAMDPIVVQKWRTLEHQREQDDVMSTIRSSMPGALVLGDYVVEGNHYGSYAGDDSGGATEDSEVRSFENSLSNLFSLFHESEPEGNSSLRTRLRSLQRSYRNTRLDVLGESFGIPAAAASSSAARTIAVSSGESSDDSLTALSNHSRSERSRHWDEVVSEGFGFPATAASGSTATVIAPSSENNDNSLIGHRRRIRSERRRRSERIHSRLW